MCFFQNKEGFAYFFQNGGDIGAHHDNSPLRGAKGSLYEGGTRVVGFVHGPMVENPGTVHDG